MNQNLAIIKLADILQVSVKEDEDETIKLFIDRINELMQKDFPTLLNILYRIDVSEEKLRELLKSQPQTDAAILIMGMIIERQKEKLHSRDINKNFGDIPEDEKW